jgi:phenylalanyl-tRNA synthetase beta chain
MHPGRCAAIEIDGQVVGHVGELHPRWRQAYELPQAPVLFELDLAAVQRRDVPLAQPVPRQQAVQRDLALVVSEQVTHDELMATLRADEAGLVRHATLFDIYRPAAPTADIPAGHRSLAVRLELLDDAATLTEERIEAVVSQAVARAQAAHGARLRS